MNTIESFTFTTTSFITEYLLVLLFVVLLYFTAASVVSLFYWCCKRLNIGDVIEKKQRKENQIKSEIRWGLVTSSIAAMCLTLALLFIEKTYPLDIQSAVINVAIAIILYDFYMYVIHRLMHVTWLSKFHSRHHKSVSTTPWSCFSLHPVDALLNFFPFIIFPLILPVSLAVFFGIFTYLIFGIANGHSNYDLFSNSKRIPLLHELTHFHQQHHSSGKANFGYLFTHWDWVFGTKHVNN